MLAQLYNYASDNRGEDEHSNVFQEQEKTTPRRSAGFILAHGDCLPSLGLQEKKYAIRAQEIEPHHDRQGVGHAARGRRGLVA